MKRPTRLFGWIISLLIVALGQPARSGWLGAIAAVCGLALFLHSIPSNFSLRRRFLSGTAWFTAVQMVQLSWMTSIEFQGYYILFVYAALSLGVGSQFGLLTMAIPAEGKISLPKIITCAALWTLMEWFRLFFLCGFSWNPLGLSLTHFASSLQFAGVFGVFGLSFWAILTNLIALNVLRNRSLKLHAGAMAAAAAIPYLFGAVNLAYHQKQSSAEDKKIAVALVQTDLLPSQKSPHLGRMGEYISPYAQWEKILKSLKEQGRAHWDMIVFPEAFVPLQSDMTLYPMDIVKEAMIKELGPEVAPHFPPLSYPFAEERLVHGAMVACVSNLFWCQTLSNYFGSEVVAGLDHTDRISEKNFNSAFYLKPGSDHLQRYDKQVLLPLAEYLPLDFLRPLSKRYGIFDFFAQGDGSKVFGHKIRFSPSICYEETFPEVMREGRAKGACLFVNVTNDNYYPASSLHEQHLFHARIRAVENGIPLVRSCNSGISAAIDSFGAVQSAGDSSHGVLSCHLKSYTYPTLYTFWGEAGIVGICLIVCFAAWRRRAGDCDEIFN